MNEFRLRAVEPEAPADERLERPAASRPAGAWWAWQPVHGGCGLSTLNRAVPGGYAFDPAGSAHERWPDLPVVAVCRSHHAGLTAGQDFARHVHLADGWSVIGLVVVADGPARLPKELDQLLRLVSGGYTVVPADGGERFGPGRVWRAGWVEAWRRGEPVDPTNTPESYRAILRDLAVTTGMANEI